MHSTKKQKIIMTSISCFFTAIMTTESVYADLPAPYKQVCISLGSKNSLTPEQQNFKNICNKIVGLDDKADNDAVAALRHEEIATQGNASIESSRKHTASISQRINTLRQSKVGGSSGDDNNLLEASRWGFFTNIGHNKGDRIKTVGVTGVGALGDASQAMVQGERAFDYDGSDLSIGLDYRFPGDKFIVGTALGYNKIESTFTTQAGRTKLKGQHISAYTSYLPSEHMYIDGIISLGNNAINASRPVPVFDNVTGVVLATDGRAFADTDSQQIAMSIGIGYEYNRSAWNITPYTRLDYTKTKIDNYTETVLDNNPTGRDSRGMILSIKDQSATSLISTLGIRTSYPISSSGGVFIPQASLELNHQFKSDERFINATLPVASNLGSDNPNTQTSQLDRNYLTLGVGVSAIFPNGHSGFVQIESLQGSDDLSDTAIKAGYRLEF